jgi:hypothetical protein
MPGKSITSQQVEIFMTARKIGYTQIVSCAKAGISERSGRAIEKEKWQKNKDKKLRWRIRNDPLSSIWEPDLYRLTRNPNLQPITLLEYIQEI